MEVWGGNQSVDAGVVMVGLDAWVYSRPYGQASGGGDVYYVSSCATGRITRLLVADVSGHGSGVSDIATQLRTLMRKYINHIDQAKFVGSMNERFTAMSTAGVFATAVVTTYFSPTRELRLCNAGHPPPLIWRSRTHDWSFLWQSEAVPAGNIPLGIIELDDYEQLDVKLEVGDLVICYTDSLIECKGADGQMLGTAGLLSLVRELDVSDGATLIPTLLDRIECLADGNLLADDVTVMLFRANGLGAGTPLKQRVLAPIRVLKAALESALGRGPAAWPELSIANIGGAVISTLSRFTRKKQGSAP
jgi:serine phosphatase RsbU (regulator of sigma subunit)